MFRNKAGIVKILGFVGAVVAAAGLALNGQTVEAVGVVAAALSSSTVMQKE